MSSGLESRRLNGGAPSGTPVVEEITSPVGVRTQRREVCFGIGPPESADSVV
ncbi:UNVERIFIED_CONTAM: hypothetical protein Sradi_6347300 [Sesamum radiatum]|uniref:Uncharacterized protein n=1 Tax=Sesamum radiatum TaxID=300843 RepID=A0AAW2K279_SESRA